MLPHTCQTCQASVGVAKYSPAHTSVQWNAAAAATCPARAAIAASPEASAGYLLRCEALDASIDEAVARGEIDQSLRAEPVVVPLHQSSPALKP